MIRSIFINPDGSSRCVYCDGLSEFFDMVDAQIERVSNVEFDHKSRMWISRLEDGTIIAKDKNRDVAIQGEIKYLEEELRLGKFRPFGGKVEIDTL
jgi:hypothetical protein